VGGRAFIVPGAIALEWARAFVLFAREAQAETPVRRNGFYKASRADLARVFASSRSATACGGVIFKRSDHFHAQGVRRAPLADPLDLRYRHARVRRLPDRCGGAAVRRLVARPPSAQVGVIPVVALQVPLLALAGTTESYLMLATVVAMMFFVFGQIPITTP